MDPNAGRVPLDAWSNEWLALVGPDLKPKTRAGYESLLRSRILPTFGAWPIANVGPGDVDAWIAGMRRDGLSPSRIRQAHVVLSAMLDLAVRHDRIARNVARGADLPPIRRTEAPYFEPGVIDRIIDAMPDRYQAFVAVQGVLGARFGEAAALRRRSVDLLRRRLLVSESIAEVGGRLSFGRTKTHAERTLPLPPALATRLEGHLEHVAAAADALLFTSSTGYPIRHRNFLRRVWYPTLTELGLPLVGVHVLRHSAAARMIGAGWSAKAVQSTLGHASASFTLTVYGHLFESDMDELAAALESPRRRTGDVRAATTR
jgi:integrase